MSTVNLQGGAIPAFWLWLGHAAFAGLLAAALLRRPWGWLAPDTRQHAFAGAVVACMLLWSIAGRIGGGPSFHVLGTTVLTLMFGPSLAFIAAALVLVGVTAAGAAGWAAFGVNSLLMAAIPIAVSYAVYRWADRRLPNHFFVYVLVCAFVNGGLAMTASRLAARGLASVAGIPAGEVAASDYLIATVLLAWAEALITGMLITIFVVYRPGWVRLFDDRRYLVGR